MPGPGRDLLLLAALVAAPLAAAVTGAHGPARATLNLGPGDGPYVTGFMPEYEIAGTEATHWSGSDASVRLPLSVRGSATLSYRFARNLPEVNTVDVWLGEERIDRFAAQPVFETRHPAVQASTPRPLIVNFKVGSPVRSPLGLRLDWVSLEAGDGATIRLRGAARWRPAWLVALLFVLFRCSGWGSRASALLAAPWSVAAGLGLRLDPWLVHRLLTAVPEWTTALGAAGVALGLWLRIRGRIEAETLRIVTALAVMAFLLRALALNHPDYYHPDLRSHVRLVEVVRRAGWDFLRSPARYILEHGVWSRVVEGRSYAFPYTPAFHSLFALGPPGYDALITAVKLGGAALSTVPIVALWTLSRRLEASSLGVLLLPFVPVYGLHLALVYLAAVFGHAVDMAFLAWLGGRLERITSLRVWLSGVVFVAGCQLAYVSSVTVLPVFVTALAVSDLLENRGSGAGPRRALSILAFGAAGSLLAVALYYRHFLGLAFDLLAGAAQGAALTAAGDAPVQSFLGLTVSHTRRFFDASYPLLGVWGLVLLVRRGRGRALLAAWAATYFFLLLGRAKLPIVFQHPHDALFVAPLVCLGAGEAIAALGSGGSWRRALAGLLFLGLAAQGLVLQWQALAGQFGYAR